MISSSQGMAVVQAWLPPPLLWGRDEGDCAFVRHSLRCCCCSSSECCCCWVARCRRRGEAQRDCNRIADRRGVPLPGRGGFVLVCGIWAPGVDGKGARARSPGSGLEDGCGQSARTGVAGGAGRDALPGNAGKAWDGADEDACELFRQLQRGGVKRRRADFVCILKACVSPKSVALGKLVHAQMVDMGMESNVVAGTALVSMYGKCGRIEDARRTFDRMYRRDVVAWNAMIAGCARLGYAEEAFNLFEQMQQEGMKPNKITVLSILNACARPEAISLGRLIHNYVVESEIEFDVVVGTALISMYGKCGSTEDAKKAFENTPKGDAAPWNAMLGGYAQYGQYEEALKLFRQMHREGVKPNKITFVSTLHSFSSKEALAMGRMLHLDIVDSGTVSDVVVGTALVSMYGRCGSVEDARRVFDRMPERNVVSWTAMITGYAQHGNSAEASRLFWQMQQQEGMRPNKITFVCMLDACTGPETLALGKLVHAYIANGGVNSCVVKNALISMYGRCGSMEDACRIFSEMPERDVVSWTAMIAGHIHARNGKEAFKFFQQMQQEGVKPNKITFISILNALTSPEALALGKLLHAHIISSEFESDVVVSNALISAYVKCWSIGSAQEMFDKLLERDVVSWTIMITGYIWHLQGEKAMTLFLEMQQEGTKPDKFAYISILDACANTGALTQGKLVHTSIVENGMESDILIGNVLVNMYAKCGSIDDALMMFDKMPEWDEVSLNTMIAAYANHGHGKEAIQLFQQMQTEGLHPNEITLVGVLVACSHAGLVDEGLFYFNSMFKDHGITPTIEHYNCMVDILCRAGQLDEAEDFINKMSLQPNAVTWMTLLSSCRVHGCMKRGENAAERALELDPQFDSPYVVLSNIYAAVGRWDDVTKVRKRMADMALNKDPGCSSIEVNNKVHEFVVGDRSHLQTNEIYGELERLTNEMEEAGYVPDTKLVLHDVGEDQKEHLLCHHSEKLAIAFGLINMPHDMPLRIIKNLRVCCDCHTAIKFISKVVQREIVIRDSNRFHCFKDGVCSCDDYW